MRFNFLLPFPSTKPVGGVKIMYEYANRISSRGHSVCILHSISRPFKKSSTPLWLKGAILSLRNVSRPRWFPLRPEVVSKVIPEAIDRFVPDADVTVSTWWEMAHMVAKLSGSKGIKVNLVQDYEVWNGFEDLVHESYKLPIQHVCISKYLTRTVAAYADFTPFHLPNAIDLKIFGCRVAPLERDPRSVIMLLSPELRKGSRFGIEALGALRARFPSLKATLFGVHPRPDLPAWIRYHQKPSDLPSLYNQHAIFLSPSLGEGWALPPAEAMCCGCAVVCTDIGGHQDYAIHDQTANLVPPESSDAIVESISSLIQSPAHRVSLARSGAEFIKSNFSWDTNTDRLIGKVSGWLKTCENLSGDALRNPVCKAPINSLGENANNLHSPTEDPFF
jgi:glycosyltransferase involved in cell wall biosynthesis